MWSDGLQTDTHAVDFSTREVEDVLKKLVSDELFMERNSSSEGRIPTTSKNLFVFCFFERIEMLLVKLWTFTPLRSLVHVCDSHVLFPVSVWSKIVDGAVLFWEVH